MFIGHYGAGLAAKRIAPKASLGAFFMAALWLDLIWPVFLLLDVERITISPGITRVTPIDFVYYPFSHSLIAAFIWALAFALFYFAWRQRAKEAGVLGALVLSHWFLDLIVHRPDLPMGFGEGAKAGLGLWGSVPGTLIVEGGIFIAGAALYFTSTRTSNKRGRFGAWGLVATLVMIYSLQFAGAAPPNERVVAVSGFLQWLFIIAAFRVDKNRVPV